MATFHRDVVGCFIWDVPATYRKMSLRGPYDILWPGGYGLWLYAFQNIIFFANASKITNRTCIGANTSKDLLNEVQQVIYSLFRAEELLKKYITILRFQQRYNTKRILYAWILKLFYLRDCVIVYITQSRR